MKRWLLWAVVATIAAVALVYGGILLWTKVINRPEEALDERDLSERLAETTTTAPDAPVETTAPAGATTEPPAVGTTDRSAAGSVEGTWVAAPDSELGYRVPEVLGGVDTEGVGRTNQVDGSITIEGTTVTAAEFVVDVASIRSDQSRRDAQFSGRIMDTATYPTASFVLTEPIELGAIPADGEQITVTATGELTLRGTTRPVTFELTAEYTNGRIGVFGTINVVFADYGIPDPSNAFVSTGDDGLLEFILLFDRA